MQNNPRKQDIIQELRGKHQDVPELCTEAEAVNELHTDFGIVTDCFYLKVRKRPGNHSPFEPDPAERSSGTNRHSARP